MKVTIATTAHSPSDGRMGYKTARTLMQRGIEVTWLGPEAELPAELVGIDYRPTGTKGRLRRFLAAARIAVRAPTDTDWFVTPDLDVLAALLLRRLIRRDMRIAFDVHEDFTGYVLHRDLGHSKSGRLLIPLLTWVMRRLVATVDLQYGVNEEVLFALGCDTQHVVVNTPRSDFAVATRLTSEDDGIFRLYHGKATEHHGTESVLTAVRSLGRDDVKVVLVSGYGRDPYGGSRPLPAVLRSQGLDTVSEIRQSVAYSEMPWEYQRCHAGIIAYSGKAAEMSLPNRLFEYAASGLPVIVPAFSPLMAAFVSQHRIGHVVDTQDPDAIAEVIAHWLDHPDERIAAGQRAGALFRASYTWESQFDAIVQEMVTRV